MGGVQVKRDIEHLRGALSGRRVFAHVVEDHFDLYARLCAIPSATGVQLELCRLGLTSLDYDTDAAKFDDLRISFADSVRFFDGLTPLQYEILKLRHLGTQEHEIYFRTVPDYDLYPVLVAIGDEGGTCGHRLQSGHICRRPRNPGQPKCWQHASEASQPVTHVTRSGEEFVCKSESTDGWSVVRGTRCVSPSASSIADLLGLRLADVSIAIQEAYSTIRDNIARRYGDDEC